MFELWYDLWAFVSPKHIHVQVFLYVRVSGILDFYFKIIQVSSQFIIFISKQSILPMLNIT